MRAAAVIYVGDLERMRTFYEACFALVTTDDGVGYCTLESDSWSLTFVETDKARPTREPAPRRTQTPIKLEFDVAGIADVRATVADLGGAVDDVETEWEFGPTRRCDCVDPEGNVIQLVEPISG